LVEKLDLRPRLGAVNAREVISSGEKTIRRMKAERAISFELLLGEPLIQRGLVRKIVVSLFIVKDVVVLSPVSDALM
jgi:hypothetical protein